MKKIILSLFTLLTVTATTAFAQQKERHEMTGTSVVINAPDYRNSRSIESVNEDGREFIMGKNRVYDNAKNGEPAKGIQPYAEYAIKSQMGGGRFVVTVTYKIDKDERKANKKDDRYIQIALDEHSPERIELKNSASGHLKATAEFDMAFLRGKNHLVKLWLPSKGVMIDKIAIRRKIIK
ncbi:MAG: hypothetical protein ACRCZY_04000 [Phocaeicola sp.]